MKTTTSFSTLLMTLIALEGVSAIPFTLENATAPSTPSLSTQQKRPFLGHYFGPGPVISTGLDGQSPKRTIEPLEEGHGPVVPSHLLTQSQVDSLKASSGLQKATRSHQLFGEGGGDGEGQGRKEVPENGSSGAAFAG